MMSRCPNCAEVQEVNAHLRRRVAEALEELERLKADPRLTLRFSAGVINGDKEKTLAACSQEDLAKELASELSLVFGAVGFSHDHQKQAEESGAKS